MRRTDPRIDDAHAWHDSPFGRIDVSWQRTVAGVRIEVNRMHSKLAASSAATLVRRRAEADCLPVQRS